MSRSLRLATLELRDELLKAAGHDCRRVIELGVDEFGPECGCGYAGQVVATEPAALDSLLRHLATEAEMLGRNGLVGYGWKGATPAAKNAQQ